MSFKSLRVGTRNRKCLASFCILLLELLIVGSMINQIGAQRTVSVILEPYHSFTRPNPVVSLKNETVQIDLALTKFTSVTDIVRFKFVLKYSTAIVDVDDVLIGSFLYDDKASITRYINEPLGEVGLDVQLPTASAKSGTGTLATIFFKGTSVGITPLNIAGGVQLWDTQGELTVLPEAGASIQIVKTKLYIDPRLTSNKTIGEAFDITIKLENVAKLTGFELRLNWTASVLDLVRIDIFKLWGDLTFIVPNSSVAGRYWFGEAGLYPAPAFTGNSTLATLTFTVKGKGNFAFDLNGVKLGDDSKPTLAIMTAVVDGYFSNVATKLSASVIVDSYYQPGATVLANLTISEADLLYGFEIKLRYDTAILDALSVELPAGHLLEPQINPTLINFTYDINDGLGFVRVSVNLKSPEAARSGMGVLATVVFKVTAVGSTKLDLFSTRLFDQDGALLTHSVENGEFTNWRNVAVLGVVASPKLLKAGGNVTIEVEFRNSGAGTQSVNLTLSFEAHLTRTEVFQVDKIQRNFTLSHLPIMNGSEKVMISGIAQNKSSNYQLDYTAGNLTFLVSPPIPSNVTVTYVQIKEGNITAFTGVELLSGEIRTLRSDWNTKGLEFFAGVYNITGKVETAVDDNPADNAASTLVTLQPLNHDVAIISLYPQPNRVKVGDSVQVWMAVKNLGTETETFNLTVYYGDNSVIGEKADITLKSRYAEVIGFTWNTAGLPLGVYKIKSVVSNVTGEVRTDNNVYQCEREVFILLTLEEAYTLPVTTIALAAAIIIIVAVVAVSLLRRRG